jgi:hypothetical protein
MGDQSPHFYSSIFVFAVSGGIIPREQKQFLGSVPQLFDLRKQAYLTIWLVPLWF